MVGKIRAINYSLGGTSIIRREIGKQSIINGERFTVSEIVKSVNNKNGNVTFYISGVNEQNEEGLWKEVFPLSYEVECDLVNLLSYEAN